MDLKDSSELRILHQQYQDRATEFQVTWEEAFGEKQQRPNLYNKSSLNETLPTITEPSAFISQLADADKLSQKELFVALENSQMALEAAQDEYLAIEMVLRHLQGSNTDEVLNPRELEDFDVFEEKKRAMLYGYKYDPKILVTSLKIQDPFSQGGFVPTESVLARMRNAAGPDLRNVDGFPPVERNGRMMIPRLHWEKKKPKPRTVHTPPRTRKRSYEEMETPNASRPTSSEGSSKFDLQAANKRLTRFAGAKVPSTRDASETPAIANTPRRGRGLQAAQRSALSAAVSPAPDGSPAKRRRQQIIHDTIQSAVDSPVPENSPTPSQVATNSARNTPTPRNKKTTKGKSDKPEKWTNESLLKAIEEDPTFLDPNDPVHRDELKQKLLRATNPVRSWSMLCKWGDWRQRGEDKRPRKKN